MKFNFKYQPATKAAAEEYFDKSFYSKTLAEYNDVAYRPIKRGEFGLSKKSDMAFQAAFDGNDCFIILEKKEPPFQMPNDMAVITSAAVYARVNLYNFEKTWKSMGGKFKFGPIQRNKNYINSSTGYIELSLVDSPGQFRYIADSNT